MKRSDNLSSGTKKTVTKKSTAKSSSKKPKVTSKTGKPRSASAGKKTSSKPSSKTRTSKAAPAPKVAPKRSTHHIGVVARGQYVKNLYEVTKRKEGAERVAAINVESKRIQNLVNKRIAKLTKLEAETGYTSPALRKLRESGYGHGATSKWGADFVQEAEENYKAVLDFLKDKTSTVTGTKKNIKSILEELQEAGFSGDSITPEQYDMFKALSERFYSESNKYKWYMINGSRDQQEMRDAINREIVALLGAGDLDAALKMADDRLDELYIESQRGSF